MEVKELQETVAAGAVLQVRGGGSKAALARPQAGCRSLELATMRGIVEYVPEEYTITVLAGTPIAQLDSLLAAHGQYLPFDPLLVAAGATAGGSVAAGSSGPGRLRYGGLRDFLLGVRFVDGRGRLVRGGGRVVKNAAGFDIPKLMVGSLGCLGVLVELTFKVFPAPEARCTLVAEVATTARSLAVLRHLNELPLDLEALDFEPPGRLWIRIGGPRAVLSTRIDRLGREVAGALGERVPAAEIAVIEAQEESAHWQSSRDFEWLPAAASLIKIPLTPARIGPLEEGLREWQIARRYSGGGAQVFLAWKGPQQPLHRLLESQGLSGLVLLGGGGPLLGAPLPGGRFAERVKRVLDPQDRFLPLPVPASEPPATGGL